MKLRVSFDLKGTKDFFGGTYPLRKPSEFFSFVHYSCR